jgi:prepilin-type N-terminal cleavage/methylation domain-containing protein
MEKPVRRSQRGFSLVELLIVVGIIMILVAVAIPLTQTTLLNYRANAAMGGVSSQLRLARELAISRRRNVEIDFTAPNKIQIHTWTVLNEPPIPDPIPVYLNDNIANGMQFYLTPGVPDTPMQFGNSSPISLSRPSGAGGWAVMFTSSGNMVGADPTTTANMNSVGNSNTLNATLFIGLPANSGNTETARAVTILGATGRVRSYTWSGSQWFE